MKDGKHFPIVHKNAHTSYSGIKDSKDNKSQTSLLRAFSGTWSLDL